MPASRRWRPHGAGTRRSEFFGVTIDRDDEASARIAQQLPGVRFFLDYDREVSTAYGAVAEPGPGPAEPPSPEHGARVPMSPLARKIAPIGFLAREIADEIPALLPR